LITDDGAGFDLSSVDQASHFGLQLMRERVEAAGSFGCHELAWPRNGRVGPSPFGDPDQRKQRNNPPDESRGLSRGG
jgi:hypothetical protein